MEILCKHTTSYINQLEVCDDLKHMPRSVCESEVFLHFCSDEENVDVRSSTMHDAHIVKLGDHGEDI